MSAIGGKWNGDQWLKAMKTAAEDGLFAGAVVAADSATRSFGRNHGGAASKVGFPPNVQTGNLRNSVTAVHARDLGRPLASAFGTNVPYGRYLEYGAIIRSKGKLLTIPLNKKAKRMLANVGGNIRALKLIYVKTVTKEHGGGAFLCAPQRKVKGVKKPLEPLFRLQKWARLEARPWLHVVIPRDGPKIYRMMDRVFKKRMKDLYHGLP